MNSKQNILARVSAQTKLYKYSYDHFQTRDWRSLHKSVYDLSKDEFVMIIPGTCNGLEYQCITDFGIGWISTQDFEYV